MRGCWALASAASLLLAETLSTVIGLFDGWKADAWISGAANWHPAKATAKPASAPRRASGFVLGLWEPVDRSVSFRVMASDSSINVFEPVFFPGSCFRALAARIGRIPTGTSHTQSRMATNSHRALAGLGRKLCPLSGNIA